MLTWFLSASWTALFAGEVASAVGEVDPKSQGAARAKLSRTPVFSHSATRLRHGVGVSQGSALADDHASEVGARLGEGTNLRHSPIVARGAQ